MKEVGELFINAIEHWRDAKGIGTAIIHFPLNDKLMVLGVLQRVYSRSPTCKTVIFTSTYEERRNIIDFLTNQEDEDNNKEFKDLLDKNNIKVFTDKFLDYNKDYHSAYLGICYHIGENCNNVLDYIRNCKFRLIVLNKLLSDFAIMNKIYQIAPILPDFKEQEVGMIRLSTPVEEVQLGIDLPINTVEEHEYKTYSEYISTSINIFGSFEIMQQANRGNTNLNISADQMCYKIAIENGWHEHLDMSIEINRQIDELYNPMSLRDRAVQTYDYIRKRNQLLSDYDGKLDIILELVNKHKYEKILIISKRGEFANKITDYINIEVNDIICMNYHDKVENVPQYNDDGSPVVYKTGAKKGQIKLIGSKAQKTQAVKLFNSNRINVLSTNNAPDKDLAIDVDVVIITSPMCESIKSYMYRLSKINFNKSRLLLYSLYIKGTSEQNLLNNKERTLHQNVKNTTDDEIYSNFVVVD